MTTPLCGAKKRQGEGTCTLPAGTGTDHLGTGKCKYHGGNTKAHRKAGRREAARLALEKLAVPITGDPIVVLEEAIASAFGFLKAARTLLSEAQGTEADALAELYAQSIDRAARTAKLGVDAKLDEQRLQLDRERAQMIVVIFRAGLDAFERSGSREDAERALIAELRNVSPDVPVGAGLN